MIPIDVRGLDQASARLLDRSSRIVGWGSGSVFDYFHTLYPVRLDYVVDNDAQRWGSWRRGAQIVEPARLKEENPAETFIVVYSSAWPEIQRQIKAIGDFASLPASAVFADASVRTRLAWSEQLASRPRERRMLRGENAVVVQGPVIPGVTPHVLRVMTALHPDARVILSTWTDTDPDLLATVSSIADDVVVSVRPASGSIQNRNFQIVSTRAGIERAIAQGARRILKTRTDLAVLATSVFEQARWWLDRIGNRPARAAGLGERLIVPSSFTRKFLLYHPSDLVMLGTAEDMLQYWSAPLDARSGSLLSEAWIDRPLTAVNLDGNPTESYLGLEFCRTLGRPVEGTLADSWAFYRDLFAVVDNDWFDLLWFKNLSIPDLALRNGVRQMVTQSFWQRLDARDPQLDDEIGELDPRTIALRSLAGAA
jgi:hypothetical protein